VDRYCRMGLAGRQALFGGGGAGARRQFCLEPRAYHTC
jgi:hypothetical protein